MASVCGRSLGRILGSNPARGLDVGVLSVLCVVGTDLRRADHPSRGVLPILINKPRKQGGPDPLRLSSHEKKMSEEEHVISIV